MTQDTPDMELGATRAILIGLLDVGAIIINVVMPLFLIYSILFGFAPLWVRILYPVLWYIVIILVFGCVRCFLHKDYMGTIGFFIMWWVVNILMGVL
jgi:hypothetical protein